MQNIASILLVFLSSALFAQRSFTFSQPELQQWKGDVDFFEVSNNKLQSNGPQKTGKISLFTESDYVLNTTWEIYIDLAFNPSTSNYPIIYLCADSITADNSLQGYYLKVGGSSGSADGVDLYRQDGESQTRIISGIKGTIGKERNEFRIKVNHLANGYWELYLDTLAGYNYQFQDKVFDTTYTKSKWFGIVCNHTSTRSNKFTFDDIKISKGPVVPVNAYAENDTTVWIHFSEIFQAPNAEQSFYIDNIGVQKVEITEQIVKLSTTAPLQPGTYNVRVNDLAGQNGQAFRDTSISFIYYKAPPYGSVVINEIFPDPSPSQNLPEFEFIEILNIGTDTINIENYHFSDANTSAPLKTTLLPPYEPLILCPEAAGKYFKKYGNFVEVTPWPSLNNTGDSLSITDSLKNLIFTVSYNDSWYKDKSKMSGGYSIEMIDPSSYCQQKKNWSASLSPEGGTPGVINSIYNNSYDKEGPKIITSSFSSSNEVNLVFDEQLYDTSKSVFFLDSKVCHPIYSRSLDTVKLYPPFQLTPNSFYYLTLKKVSDCKSNISDSSLIELLYPDKASAFDIIINEVLFNPRPEGVDFVEFYNRSEKYIDLHDLYIANESEDTIQLTDKEYILYPDDYLVLTTNSEKLLSGYPSTISEKLIEIKGMPPFRDEQGSVILSTKNMVIDRFDYLDSYHNPLISETEGVSLERISTEFSTNSPSNWHSASTSAGSSTPGYKNSQAKKVINKNEKNFYIDPKTFTPDGDGYNDFIQIKYKVQTEGWFGKVKIFDIQGRLIKNLVNNELLGKEGFFSWNGSMDSGRKAPVGLYIVFAEFFKTDGQSISYKETVAVGTKF